MNFAIIDEGPGFIEVVWDDGRIERMDPERYNQYLEQGVEDLTDESEKELDFEEDSDYKYDEGY